MHLIFPQRTRLIFLSYTKKYVWQSSNEKKTNFETVKVQPSGIGEVSQDTGISKDTLHFYDKIGLLVPDHIDPNNQYRYYSLRNLWQLDMITTCRKLNIPLETVKKILSLKDRGAASCVVDQKEVWICFGFKLFGKGKIYKAQRIFKDGSSGICSYFPK
ncbi:MerR family transcriptional regulator [Catenibacillus scindens]|uniref:MerR family transcriptional regulator n=1 Tax=Catenibacillus scindens TaxID=673271 RepID=UPI00320915A5